VVEAEPEALLDGLRSIPTLSIVTDPASLFGPEGIYENSTERGEEWERAVSVEWILPDGTTGFQEDCGLRIHGYGWRANSVTPKHSFRLEFNRSYGAPKLDYPIFPDAPVSRFDSIVLRAGGSKTWLDFRDPALAQYLHDSFARDTARDMGKLDGHATYVHLYLDGLYWGLYNAVERPEADFGAEYLGGEADEYDAINRRTVTNEAVDGTLEAYEELLRRAEADLSTAAGLASVEEMLDLDDLIDYMLIHQYTTNRDGPCCFSSNNMRGLRRRAEGEQFRFFVWDMEYSLWEATDAINVDIDVEGSISHVYTRLRENADFRARYSDRAHLHLTGSGALTPEAAAARYAGRAEEIHGALLAESARWGDTFRTVPYTRDVEWQAEYDRLMTEYFPNRSAELIAQLTAAGLYLP
jgi:CotH kinase protein